MISSALLIKPIYAQENGYTDISATQAYQMLANDPTIITLDVRNQSEYDMGHLCNAVLEPLFNLTNWIGNLSSTQIDGLNESTLIVYCLSGTRSTLACQILANDGFMNVYNMQGGITAWMNCGYPISTTYHTATFSTTNNDTEVDIQPLLLTDCGCNSSQTNSVNTSRTILENDGNNSVVSLQQQYNGTTNQYTINETCLWAYSNITDAVNRTLTFSSATTTWGTQSAQDYILREDVCVINDYNLSMVTVLEPLDAETYNSSSTGIVYVAYNETTPQTMEILSSNSTLTLSTLYSSLSTVIEQLGEGYGGSEDQTLHVFEARYSDIAEEANIVSQLVQENLTMYDKEILKSGGLLIDDAYECIFVAIVASAVFAGAGCFFAPPLCLEIVQEVALEGWEGAVLLCDQLFDCHLQSPVNYPPWMNGSLVNPDTLTISGSSTVYPMASEEQTGGATGGMGFDTYWNSLAANTGSAAVQITNV